MKRDYSKHLRRFHEAKWDEELIFDLSVPGQRGVNVTKPSPQRRRRRHSSLHEKKDTPVPA